MHPDDVAPNPPPPAAAVPAASWPATLLSKLDGLVERLARGEALVEELLFRVARLEDAAAGVVRDIGAFGRDEQVVEHIAAIADQMILGRLAQIVAHRVLLQSPA